jgi:hypothetical protein
VVGA